MTEHLKNIVHELLYLSIFFDQKEYIFGTEAVALSICMSITCLMIVK